MARAQLTIDPSLFPPTVDPGEASVASDIEFVSLDPRTSPDIDGFVIFDQLDLNGSQSNIYKARKDGLTYAIKIYRKGFEGVGKVRDLLSSGECENIAKLISWGYYQTDYYYEVFPLYQGGTLKDMLDERNSGLDSRFIESVLIPSIDSALNYLHSNGLVHGDIKPQNIFLTHDRKKAVLGDFGVASLKSKDGEMMPFRGTLEYSPHTLNRVDDLIKVDPAYDYGSLGLVLVQAYSGISLLRNRDMRERAEILCNPTVPVEVFRGSATAEYVLGLLQSDEKRRFGHKETLAFLGKKATVAGSTGRPSFSLGSTSMCGFEFGYCGEIGGKLEIAYSLSDLLELSENYQSNIGVLLDSPKLHRFLGENAPDDFRQKYIDAFRRRTKDERVFAFCCGLRFVVEGTAGDRFACGGKCYEGIFAFLQKVAQSDIEVVSDSLLSFAVPLYLETFDYGREAAEKVKEILSMPSSVQMKANKLLAIFDAEVHKLIIDGKVILDVEELLDCLQKMGWEETVTLSKDSSLIPWLAKNHCEKVCAELEGLS